MGLKILIGMCLSLQSDLSFSLSLLAHWMGASTIATCCCNAANIGSEGLYGALRVWFGMGLEASWLNQNVCPRLGLCLFDQRSICLGLFKELRELV